MYLCIFFYLLYYLNNKALKNLQYSQRYVLACIEKVIGLQNNGNILYSSNSSVNLTMDSETFCGDHIIL